MRNRKQENEQIAQECERLGIPSQFAPRLTMGWHGQWRNGDKEERTEMRRVASKQVDATLKSALAAVERVSVAAQERIMVGGLSTDDARRYLESMPTAEALMPALTLDRLSICSTGETRRHGGLPMKPSGLSTSRSSAREGETSPHKSVPISCGLAMRSGKAWRSTQPAHLMSMRRREKRGPKTENERSTK